MQQQQYENLFEKSKEESQILLNFLRNKKAIGATQETNKENEVVKIKFKNNNDNVQLIHNGDEILIFLDQKNYGEFTPQRTLTVEGAIQVLNDLFDQPIEELGFTPRTYNLLKRGGVNNKIELKNMTFQEIAKIRNMSRKAVKEIESKLNIEFE